MLLVDPFDLGGQLGLHLIQLVPVVLGLYQVSMPLLNQVVQRVDLTVDLERLDPHGVLVRLLHALELARSLGELLFFTCTSSSIFLSSA